MKKLLYILPLVTLLWACGDSEEQEQEVIELEDQADRLGYALGAINAQTMKQGGVPNFDKLKVDLMVQGFADNLNNNDVTDCEATIRSLYGPYMQDFDTNYLDAGSTCFGRTMGSTFYKDMDRMQGLDKIDIEMVKIGFRHGLEGNDTLIEDPEKREMVQNFIVDLNEKLGDVMLAEAAKIEGVQKFDNGIIIQTIEEGSGAMPAETDDVEVEYILTGPTGDTIQSSYAMKQMTGETKPVALGLDGGVIPAWSFGLPKMKKGGKYRMWVPWQLAYGEQGGKQSLCFFIEFVNFGPKGTLYKPEPMPQNYQGY